MKTVKSYECRLLIKVFGKQLKRKQKKQKFEYLSMFLGIIGASS